MPGWISVVFVVVLIFADVVSVVVKVVFVVEGNVFVVGVGGAAFVDF